ncbi:hypothetical protein BJ875DRAFT_455389 [Amylocarpus encephaloides]|uniref:Uncharacterized protein n=1 Tax=Amylocarpus encephaloides TaxID=45428 RepID=A0A9P7YND7_9HELO|nr:hypothetical protein BJ875DRAFT_455389 [Amylocarpus encephaloides]
MVAIMKIASTVVSLAMAFGGTANPIVHPGAVAGVEGQSKFTNTASAFVKALKLTSKQRFSEAINMLLDLTATMLVMCAMRRKLPNPSS